MSVCYGKSGTMQDQSPAVNLRSRRSLTYCSIAIKPKKTECRTLEDVQEQIMRNHQSINDIIAKFRQVVSERLQSQELELLMVFRNTVDKMMVQITEVVSTYRAAIEEVRLFSSIKQLENELSYFKTEALQLFQLNQGYKKEIQDLKKAVFDLKVDNETSNKIVHKLTKKVMAGRRMESLLTEPDRSTSRQLPFITQRSLTKSRTGTERRGKTVTSTLSKVP